MGSGTSRWQILARIVFDCQSIGTTTDVRPVERQDEFVEFIFNLPSGQTPLKAARLDPAGDLIAGILWGSLCTRAVEGSNPPLGAGPRSGARLAVACTLRSSNAP